MAWFANILNKVACNDTLQTSFPIACQQGGSHSIQYNYILYGPSPNSVQHRFILMSKLFNTCRSRPTTCAAGHLWNFPCVSMRWSSKSRYHHQASAKISSIYADNKHIDIMTLPHRRMLYILLHFPYQQLNNIMN